MSGLTEFGIQEELNQAKKDGPLLEGKSKLVLTVCIHGGLPRSISRHRDVPTWSVRWPRAACRHVSA